MIGTEIFSALNKINKIKNDINSLNFDLSSIRLFFKNPIGLNISNAGDVDHDITIATGVTLDRGTQSKLLNLTSPITKQIDSNWSEGNNQGGFPSGLTLSANNIYGVFLLSNSDGTKFDSGYDNVLNPTNLLADASSAGYTLYKRVGFVRTDAGLNILPFKFINNDYRYSTEFLEYGGSLIPITTISLSSIPLGINLKVYVVQKTSGSGSYFTVSVKSLYSGETIDTCYEASVGSRCTGNAFLYTNTLAQIQHGRVEGPGGASYWLYVIGYEDLRNE